MTIGARPSLPRPRQPAHTLPGRTARATRAHGTCAMCVWQPAPAPAPAHVCHVCHLADMTHMAHYLGMWVMWSSVPSILNRSSSAQRARSLVWLYIYGLYTVYIYIFTLKSYTSNDTLDTHRAVFIGGQHGRAVDHNQLTMSHTKGKHLVK